MVEMSRLPDKDFWSKQRVLLTGHTGFKGSWMTLWLQHLGAEVFGFALAPNTNPSIFEAAKIDKNVNGFLGDIRDAIAVNRVFSEFKPTVLIHMAAQPLVRLSYHEPVDTFSTNVVGTAIILDAARNCDSLRAIVNITTDKCYENLEQIWPYREIDRLGGKDPYSASKACAELVAASYNWSYFSKSENVGSANVRAGNVIGGGDWSKDRLVPDMAQAFASSQSAIIRNPNSVRPWQHVLDPLCGYLLAAEKIYGVPQITPNAWNFGPDSEGNVLVGELLKIFVEKWGDGASIEIRPDPNAPHEATLLALDSTKAKIELGWKPRWALDIALDKTAKWYRSFYAGEDVRKLSFEQINAYCE